FASRLANIHYWQGATDTLIQQDYLYDARDRVQQIKVYKFGTSTAYLRLYYGYDKASDIVNSTDDMYTGSGGASNAKAVNYFYDFQQQLVGIKTASSSCTSTEAWTYTHSYDGLGRRVKTYDGTTTSYFMYSGARMLYSKVGSTETAFVYLGDMLLLRKEGTA